jgi:hypothetical protein
MEFPYGNITTEMPSVLVVVSGIVKIVRPLPIGALLTCDRDPIRYEPSAGGIRCARQAGNGSGSPTTKTAADPGYPNEKGGPGMTGTALFGIDSL